MSKGAEGLAKVAVIPLGYAAAGPFIGAYRGIRGDNTPLNYDRLIRTYPNEGKISGDSIENAASAMLRDRLSYTKQDTPSEIGILVSATYGTVTAAPAWFVARSGRFAYDTVLESYRAGRNILKHEV